LDDRVALGAAVVLISSAIVITASRTGSPSSAVILSYLPALLAVILTGLVPIAIAFALMGEIPALVAGWRGDDAAKYTPLPLRRAQVRAANTATLHELIAAGLGDDEIERLHPRSRDQIARERSALQSLGDVAELVRRGQSNGEIAAALGLTVHQVEYFTRKLRERYGASDKRALSLMLNGDAQSGEPSR
jgi:hypothetical protein